VLPLEMLRLYQVFEWPQLCYSGVTVVLQWVYKVVTVVSELCYSGGTVVSSVYQVTHGLLAMCRYV
jgi:hypothetical protein